MLLKDLFFGSKGARQFCRQKSKLIKQVADVLKDEGFLESVSDDNLIASVLAYRRKEPVLMDIKLVSKPGLRIYMGVDELQSRKGPSILIVSTPKGILTSKKAIKARVGGEVICEVL